ncbi:MAG: DUF4348 domain-containing protein [Crocinitomicaceae bacterium]
MPSFRETLATVMRPLLRLTLILLLHSCGDSLKQAEVDEENESTGTVNNVNNSDSLLNQENFEEFYERFIRDSLFQRTRIRSEFDYNVYTCDSNLNLSVNDLYFIEWDYRDDISSELNYVEIDSSNNNIKIEGFRKEVGKLYYLEFEKKGNKWFLNKYESFTC